MNKLGKMYFMTYRSSLFPPIDLWIPIIYRIVIKYSAVTTTSYFFMLT